MVTLSLTISLLCIFKFIWRKSDCNIFAFLDLSYINWISWFTMESDSEHFTEAEDDDIPTT